MTDLPRLILVRHGETAWSRSGQHTGTTDIPLTGAGEAAASALGSVLSDVAFDTVLTSPMHRARQTCALAGLGERAEVRADLAEWNYGDYEGRTSADIHKTVPGWNVFGDGCPGGEMPDQIARRADVLIADLVALGGTIALFSHGQFGSALAARWIGLDVGAAVHLSFAAGAVSILGPRPGHPDVRAINRWNLEAGRLT